MFSPNEVGDPPFFYISDITNSSSFNGKFSEKKSMLENFRANVLNLFADDTNLLYADNDLKTWKPLLIVI